MQQQRVLFRRRVGKIPALLLQKAIILRMDLQLTVVWQVHLTGGLLPLGQFFATHAQAVCPGGFCRQQFTAEAQLQLYHGIGVVVVVNDSGVFIRAGNLMDLKATASTRIKKAQLQPQPAGFHQHFHPHTGHKIAIATGQVIAADRIGDGSINMVLRGTCRKVSGALLATYGAPWIERATLM